MRPSMLNIILAMGAGLAVFTPAYLGVTWWSNQFAGTLEIHENALLWINLAAYGAWTGAGFVSAAISRGWRLRIGIGTGILCTFIVFAFYLLSGSPALVSSVYEGWHLWFANGVVFSVVGALLFQAAHWLFNIPLTKASTGRGVTSRPAKPREFRDRAG